MPQLSVIIPLYNQAATVGAALNSVLAQDFPLEIVVVDDASTDGGADRVRRWQQENGFPVKIVVQPDRRYALKARLRGLEVASADNIMFLDADDQVSGSLQNVLEFKVRHELEIAHFRSLAISPDGEMQGEYLLNAPLAETRLENSKIFERYSAKSYPPVMLWGKIYSRTLLERVLPYAENKTIFRFEDKFLVSLAMFFAHSYAGCTDYCYRYTLSGKWPLEKFAGRVHDLAVIRKTFLPLLQGSRVKTQVASRFLGFLDRRHTVNMGSLCSLAEEEFRVSQNPEGVLARLSPFLEEKELFRLALKGACANVAGICDIIDRIHHDF